MLAVVQTVLFTSPKRRWHYNIDVCRYFYNLVLYIRACPHLEGLHSGREGSSLFHKYYTRLCLRLDRLFYQPNASADLFLRRKTSTRLADERFLDGLQFHFVSLTFYLFFHRWRPCQSSRRPRVSSHAFAIFFHRVAVAAFWRKPQRPKKKYRSDF